MPMAFFIVCNAYTVLYRAGLTKTARAKIFFCPFWGCFSFTLRTLMMLKKNLFTLCLIATMLSGCGSIDVNWEGTKYTINTPDLVGKMFGDSKQKNEALFNAVSNNNVNEAKRLIEEGANPNYSKKDRNHLLYMAAKQHSVPMVRLLVDKGAKINALNRDRGVKKAVNVVNCNSSNGVEIMHILLEKNNGAFLDTSFEKPMNLAAKCGLVDIVEKLGKDKLNNGSFLDSGAYTLDFAKNRPVTAYVIAQMGGKSRENKNLEKIKLDVEKELFNNPTVYELQYLIKHGVNVNAKNKEGVTPLMRAVSNNSHSVAKLLLEQGAKVNERDDLGNTALMNSAFACNENMVRLLLQHGADVKIASNKGMTALDLMDYRVNRSLFGGCYGEHTFKNIESLLTAQGATRTGKGKEEGEKAFENSLTARLVGSVIDAIAEGGKNTTYVRIDTPATGISANVCIKAPNGTEYGRSGKECSSGGTGISKKAGTYHYNVMFHNGYHNDPVWYKRAKYFGSCSGSFSTDGTEQSITLSFTRYSDNIVDCSRMNIYKN